MQDFLPYKRPFLRQKRFCIYMYTYCNGVYFLKSYFQINRMSYNQYRLKKKFNRKPQVDLMKDLAGNSETELLVLTLLPVGYDH